MDAVARCGWPMRARETGVSNERGREAGVASDRNATDYREIDRQLRRIAKRKAGLDIEEAQWLREAEKHRIWRKLGYSTALEYLEDVFGYAPRTAMERLRVAKELGALPALEAAVREGELPYSAARELTRVMTPETEGAWLASARGRNLRDIEELVAGRTKGDTPDADKNPELVKRRRVLELSPRVDALVEQCRAVLANELGSHVDDEMLTEMLCRCFLAGGAVEGQTGEQAPSTEAGKTVKMKAPRPAHRIVIYKCESCARARQQGRGRTVELTADEIALAECDGETVHWHDESYVQPGAQQSEQLASPQSDQVPAPWSDQVPAPRSDQVPAPPSEALPTPLSKQLGTPQSEQVGSPHDGQLAAPLDEALASPQDGQPSAPLDKALATPLSQRRAAREPWRTRDHVVGKHQASKSTRRLARNAAKTAGCHTGTQRSLQSEQPSTLEPSRSVARLVDAQPTPDIEPRSVPRLQQRITPDLSQRATPNIPQRIRNLVWARDRGRCRVPGCRATRCLDIHHIRPRREGGDHDPANLLVLCSGHHKLHHAGLLSISGRAPDQLVFMRGGKVLLDARSPGQTDASEALRQQAATSRFADVTRREHAKQALMQFAYKARAAGAAIDEAIAHVGREADVGTIVKAALAHGAAPQPADTDDPVVLARQALVQAGFSSATATQAVERATAHVGAPIELTGLIKEALRWCR